MNSASPPISADEQQHGRHLGQKGIARERVEGIDGLSAQGVGAEHQAVGRRGRGGESRQRPPRVFGEQDPVAELREELPQHLLGLVAGLDEHQAAPLDRRPGHRDCGRLVIDGDVGRDRQTDGRDHWHIGGQFHRQPAGRLVHLLRDEADVTLAHRRLARQLKQRRLAGADLGGIGFVHVGLDDQPAHVHDGHQHRGGIDALARIGAPVQHRARDGRADGELLKLDLRLVQQRGHPHHLLRSGLDRTGRTFQHDAGRVGAQRIGAVIGGPRILLRHQRRIKPRRRLPKEGLLRGSIQPDKYLTGLHRIAVIHQHRIQRAAHLRAHVDRLQATAPPGPPPPPPAPGPGAGGGAAAPVRPGPARRAAEPVEG